MTPNKKLSTYLNRFYYFEKIKDAKSEDIYALTNNYIQGAKDNIFRQPLIALRVIKVEMNDILIHHNRYVKELGEYTNELNSIISKGPWVDKINLKKLIVLEEKRDVLAEFVCLVGEALGCITRMLLEHYSELEKDKPFLDKFSEYLSKNDWMSKRVEHLRNEVIKNDSPNLKNHSFEWQIVELAKELIRNNEVKSALQLLSSNTKVNVIENRLASLHQQWVDFERRRNLGLLTDESSKVTMREIVDEILLII